MPELPEVETVTRGLNKFIVGKKIISTNSSNLKSFPIDQRDISKFIEGSFIEKVHRRAKMIVIELSTKKSLVVHLKMTGQLVYRGQENWGGGHPSDSLVGLLPDKSTRITFELIDKKGQLSKLFFNDQRKFGWVKLFNSLELAYAPIFINLGPEPLDERFSFRKFNKQLNRRPNSKIKAALLDQTVLSGIGNIYADESLFAAKIMPDSIVSKIPTTARKTLFNEIKKILNLSISLGGSTSRNYLNAEGKKGNYLEFAKVYGRTGLECLVCKKNVISKIKLAGRGTHICTTCQKIYL
jgi:formamidopyrimidine-DNA glycosylase